LHLISPSHDSPKRSALGIDRFHQILQVVKGFTPSA
jgi:hypothetical protein